MTVLKTEGLYSDRPDCQNCVIKDYWLRKCNYCFEMIINIIPELYVDVYI